MSDQTTPLSIASSSKRLPPTTSTLLNVANEKQLNWQNAYKDLELREKPTTTTTTAMLKVDDVGPEYLKAQQVNQITLQQIKNETQQSTPRETSYQSNRAAQPQHEDTNEDLESNEREHLLGGQERRQKDATINATNTTAAATSGYCENASDATAGHRIISPSGMSLDGEGVLNGPDIRKLIKSDAFNNILIDAELNAWQAIKEVIEGLLGKHRSNNFNVSVARMLRAFSEIGGHMSLKIHFLHHHLDYFSKQLATGSDEQGERYHQVAMPFEMRYRGKKSPSAIIAEICWWSKLVWQEKNNPDDKEFSGDAEGSTVESHIDIMCGSETDDSDECDATSPEQPPSKKSRQYLLK